MKHKMKRIVLLPLLILFVGSTAALTAIGPLRGRYFNVDLTPSILLLPIPTVDARCHVNVGSDDHFMFNPACCCTSGWCHAVPCSSIRSNGDGTFTVELQPGQHPRVFEHVLWSEVETWRTHVSPDENCYVCASHATISCVVYRAAGQV